MRINESTCFSNDCPKFPRSHSLNQLFYLMSKKSSRIQKKSLCKLCKLCNMG